MFSRLRQLFSSAPVPQAAPVFALPEGVRVYAIGDIHGRSQLLGDMLAAIRHDAAKHSGKKIVEVFLGDYIDRGLHSREVIDLLLMPSQHERICLKGNHEEAMLKFLEDPKILREWSNFGGFATLASYGVAIPVSMSPEKLAILRDAFQKNIPPEHLQFLRKLQMAFVLGDYLFVHAGIMPGVPFQEQRPEHLLWIRDPFLRHRGYFERYIVHGHSPIPAPEIYANRANLDVSAASAPSLCCLVAEGTERATMIVTNDGD